MNPEARSECSELADLSVILLVDRLDRGLWDAALSERLEHLEERLEGAHVTFAALDGAGPDLVDALRAARFVGSRRVLVAASRATTAWRLPELVDRLPVAILAVDSDDDILQFVIATQAARAA